MKNTTLLTYEELHEHIGHTIDLNDIWDWDTNRETGIEIRCRDCEGCEPLLEMDKKLEEIPCRKLGQYLG